ncbi:MAG: LytTR family transcriptional regulator [Saprospiraceae bacterium]|nr:LytTR family transcriptional regulator [Saprospiraceae bacterium]
MKNTGKNPSPPSVAKIIKLHGIKRDTSQTSKLVSGQPKQIYSLEETKLLTVEHLLQSTSLRELALLLRQAHDRSIQEESIGHYSSRPVKIGFPIATGLAFIELEEVIYAEAQNNFVRLVLANKREVKLTRSMTWLEEEVKKLGFCRIHHSYLINLNHLKEYIRNQGGFVVLSNGKAISVARRRKDEFLKRLENLKRG